MAPMIRSSNVVLFPWQVRSEEARCENVTGRRISGNRVELAVQTPKHIKIVRGELSDSGDARPEFEMELI